MAKFNIRESFKNNKSKYGGYSAMITIIILAIVVVVNLVFAQGVKQVAGKDDITFDLTTNKLFSLSKESVQIVKGLTKQVTITALFEENKDDSYIKQVKYALDKYANASKNIKVEYVDPVLHPNALREYKSNDNVTTNDVIVKCGSKYKVLSLNDMFTVSQGSDGSSQVTQNNIEQKISGAITYVMQEKTINAYILQGHNEAELDTSFDTYMENENYKTSKVNLLTQEWNPQSGDILLIGSPQKDLTDDEYSKIKKFVDNGGKVMYLANLLENDIPNFRKLLNYFGVDLSKSLIIESDQNHIISQPYILVPVQQSHDITSNLGSETLILPQCQPITTIKEKKDTVKVESILKTSDSSYSKVNLQSSTIEKEKDDLTGPFDVAVASTNTVSSTDSSKNSQLVLISSGISSMFNSSVLAESNGGNTDLFMNSMNWLAEKKATSNVRAKDLQTESLTISENQNVIMAGVLIVLIPALAIAAGVGVWLRRRHL
ncbi:GldG family protein [Clostridium sp. 19966]|uniref:GldG family protein n=1 Tax=Clostridium sp. 19966 TaxID=2768166 RepID=UPI0028E0870B|nr:GldG family protein [Clostridium sp. 19966]MDT8719115.1 GldG family protein [Clostridium sp. 19966]